MLSGIHPGQGAAGLEADGPEALRACRRGATWASLHLTESTEKGGSCGLREAGVVAVNIISRSVPQPEANSAVVSPGGSLSIANKLRVNVAGDGRPGASHYASPLTPDTYTGRGECRCSDRSLGELWMSSATYSLSTSSPVQTFTVKAGMGAPVARHLLNLTLIIETPTPLLSSSSQQMERFKYFRLPSSSS
ncbi:unnamed protein product [Pleuronectes platessa]|uniref:Uncharacterized protein n=1 Tax=Pleuronectes platessa TaxID=8262 RepID=A0A9N7TRJ6_PLEPL|nr:unnamed protein product [Pleuronectes platessa]